MKLRTSFFNSTVLRKDITRFAPVWGLYTLFTVLFVLLLWESESSAARFVNNAPELFLSMGIVNFLYAPLAAIVLFGDLFKSRMCNMLHALPLRREGWFLTHLTAGLLFCVLPNGAAALLTAALLQEYAWAAFLWLGLMVLQYLFFFGVATFASLCSGNHLGALAVYGIVNFLAVIAGWLVITFYEPLLYGIKLDFAAMARYSPIVRFCGANYLQTHFDNMTDSTVLDGFIAADWRYLGIAAGVGVVLLGLSLLIYRKRQLESAGDLIAFKPAAPVFLVIYTLCAGAVLYFFAGMAAPALQYIFLAIGLAIGFFTGRMLLERRVRVFDRKNLIGFGILAVVFAVTVGITALDPMGITRHVPEKDQVSSVTICGSHYQYDRLRDSVTLTDPADIETITGIHQQCTEGPRGDERYGVPLYICYEMKNGTSLERYYYISADSDSGKALEGFFSTVNCVFDGNDPADILKNLVFLECYSYSDDMPLIALSADTDRMNVDYYKDKYGEDSRCITYTIEGSGENDPILTGLFDAIQADCEAGNMAQLWEYNRDHEQYASVTVEYKTPYSGPYVSEYLDIQIYADCENAVAYLKSLQAETAE